MTARVTYTYIRTGARAREVDVRACVAAVDDLARRAQHPGNGDPLASNFPAEPDGVTIPRDSTIVITRKDGGVGGS